MRAVREVRESGAGSESMCEGRLQKGDGRQLAGRCVGGSCSGLGLCGGGGSWGGIATSIKACKDEAAQIWRRLHHTYSHPHALTYNFVRTNPCTNIHGNKHSQMHAHERTQAFTHPNSHA